MKIALFNGSFEVPTFVGRLLEGLTERHQVYLLGFNEKLNSPIPQVRYIPLGSNSSSLSLIRTSLFWAWKAYKVKGLFRFVFQVPKNKKALQQHNLQAFIKSEKVDIVHLQWHSLLSWFEAYPNKQDCKWILSQRGYQLNVRGMVDPENHALLKQLYPQLDGFHSVSEAISRTGDQVWKAPTKIDHVVFSGIPVQDFSYAPNKERGATLNLLSVGRAHWKKGYADGLRACAQLQKEAIPFRYRIVGAAGDEELLHLVRSLSLEDRVELLPKCTQEQVYQYMQAADLFLLPSLEEGIANVVKEAMALGTPVCSTDCGGMTEVVKDGITGWIAPAGQPDQLARSILRFQQTPQEEVDSIRKQARELIAAQHTVAEMVTGMEALYQEVIDG